MIGTGALLLFEDLRAPSRAWRGLRVALLRLLRSGPSERVGVGGDDPSQRRRDLGGGLPSRGRPHWLASFARAPARGDLDAVRHDARGHAFEAGERVHMAAQPCILLHIRRRLDAGHAAGGQAGDEQVGLGRPAQSISIIRPALRPTRLVTCLRTVDPR